VRVCVLLAAAVLGAVTSTAAAGPCAGAACRAACEAGDPVACGRWQRKARAERPPTQAELARLADQCDDALTTSCALLADVRWAKQPAEALALYQRGCVMARSETASNLATDLSCLQAAVAREHGGRGVVADPSESRRVFADLCLHVLDDELAALACRRARAMREVVPIDLGHGVTLTVELPGDLEVRDHQGYPEVTVQGRFPGIGDLPVATIAAVHARGEQPLRVARDRDRVTVDRVLRVGAAVVVCTAVVRAHADGGEDDQVARARRICESLAPSPAATDR